MPLRKGEKDGILALIRKSKAGLKRYTLVYCNAPFLSLEITESKYNRNRGVQKTWQQ